MHKETVHFQSRDGKDLAGRLDHPVGEVRGWAIFAHCFTCSKQSHASVRVARGLAERGIGVLRFDFTGLGESDGEFEETNFSSNVADLVSAAEWMAGQGHAPGLLVGHSLGGAASVVAAHQIDSVKALATINAPADAEHVIQNFGESLETIETEGQARVDLAGRPFTITRDFVQDVRGANVTEAAGQLGLPLLVLHAPTDQVVGIDNASELFRAARHPKSFVSLDQADHVLSRPEDSAFAASMIAAWASRYLDGETGSGDLPSQTHDVIVRETGCAGPFQNEVFINGQRYLADEPEAVGGSGTGPDPYGWLSTALGACTSMTLRMYARHKDWPLERVTVRLNHEKAHAEDCESCGPKDKIDVFDRQITVEGELSEEQVARLLEIADRCPVHRTLESEVRVRSDISLDGNSPDK